MLNAYEKKQINTQAKSDLVKKLKLEKTFRPEVNSLFSRMREDFRVNVAATGMAPEARNYSSAWQDALKKHYTRVQKSFLGTVKEFTGKAFIGFSEEFLDLALLLFRDERAPEQESWITKTNEKNMQDSIVQARQLQEEQEGPTDNRTIAQVASVILARKFKGRAGGIITLETQAPAEATKLFEARSLAGMAPSVEVQPVVEILRPIQPDVTKTWRTIGDNIVRDAHKDANFQTVPLTDSFIVMGEQLMYPGDNGLGASISNTIN